MSAEGLDRAARLRRRLFDGRAGPLSVVTRMYARCGRPQRAHLRRPCSLEAPVGLHTPWACPWGSRVYRSAKRASWWSLRRSAQDAKCSRARWELGCCICETSPLGGRPSVAGAWVAGHAGRPSGRQTPSAGGHDGPHGVCSEAGEALMVQLTGRGATTHLRPDSSDGSALRIGKSTCTDSRVCAIGRAASCGYASYSVDAPTSELR